MCLSEIEHEHRPGRTKRRIIGGVVRAPSEAVPVASSEHLGTGTPTLRILKIFEAFRKGSRHPGASGIGTVSEATAKRCAISPRWIPCHRLQRCWLRKTKWRKCGGNGRNGRNGPCDACDACDALMRWSRGQSLLGLWPETKRHCENLRDVRSPRHQVTRAR